MVQTHSEVHLGRSGGIARIFAAVRMTRARPAMTSLDLAFFSQLRGMGDSDGGGGGGVGKGVGFGAVMVAKISGMRVRVRVKSEVSHSVDASHLLGQITFS